MHRPGFLTSHLAGPAARSRRRSSCRGATTRHRRSWTSDGSPRRGAGNKPGRRNERSAGGGSAAPSSGDAEHSEQAEERRAELIDDYKHTFANPFRAANLGFIDEVIYPRETRKKLITALNMLGNKRQENLPRKHGNIPL